MSETVPQQSEISEAHQRILNLAARCFDLAKRCDRTRDFEESLRRLEAHGDACNALWDELEAQAKGVTGTAPPLKSNAQIEREVARDVRDRLRKALPDMIAAALDE